MKPPGGLKGSATLGYSSFCYVLRGVKGRGWTEGCTCSELGLEYVLRPTAKRARLRPTLCGEGGEEGVLVARYWASNRDFEGGYGEVLMRKSSGSGSGERKTKLHEHF